MNLHHDDYSRRADQDSIQSKTRSFHEAVEYEEDDNRERRNLKREIMRGYRNFSAD